MAKLISTKPHRANQAMSIAIVGTVTFDNDCIAEISDEQAVLLKEYLKDKESLGYEVVLNGESLKTTKPLVESKPTTSNEVDSEEGESEEGEVSINDTEASEFVASLQNMDKAALQQLAKDSDLPSEEWSQKNTRALRQYLASKLA